MKSETLETDQRGAVMVVALFMAMMMAGMMYYVVGIGDALFARERLQDAADAGALSGAIVHARGMNVIVLFNIIMAALLAIVVMLKLLSVTLLAAAGVLLALSWVPGVGAAASATLLAQKSVNKAAEAAQEAVEPALSGLNNLSTATAKLMPLAAEAKLIHSAVRYGDADVAIGAPLYKSLPVENDQFKDLCGRAGAMAASAITFPVSKLPGGNLVAKVVKKLVKGAAQKWTNFFCGVSDTRPAPPTHEVETFYPVPDAALKKACIEGEDAKCKELDQATKRARDAIDSKGNCVGPDAEACEQRAARARQLCKPGAIPNMKRWYFQTESVSQTFRLSEDRKSVIEEDPVVESQRASQNPSDNGDLNGDGQPCLGFAWSPWNTSAEGPLCHEPFDKPTVRSLLNSGRVEATVRYERVNRIHACVQVEKRPLDVDIQPMDFSEKHAAKKLCGCTQLGDPRFFIKSFLYGDATDRLLKARRGVNLATWGRDNVRTTDTLLNALELMGRFSVAEAEYYFHWQPNESKEREAEEQDPRNRMWFMRWRARLRRFRASTERPTRTCPKPTRQAPRMDVDNCPKALIPAPCSGSQSRSGKEKSLCDAVPFLPIVEGAILH